MRITNIVTIRCLAAAPLPLRGRHETDKERIEGVDKMNTVYLAIKTSGWQGDGWQYISQHDNKTDAIRACEEVSTPDAKSSGYITDVATSPQVCKSHEFCWTARLHGKTVHVSEASLYV